MKKIVLTFAFVLAAQIGMAQTNEAFKKDVLKVIDVTGSAGQMKLVKDQIIKMIPKEKQAAFLVEFEATLPSLYDKIANVYMQEYTHDDIKQILKFYETPIGKKMTEKAGVIAEKNMTASQEWGSSLQGMMMKYMQ
ncbi:MULTISPECIES: DUF2059 domain-containing protein [Flavobacterium]|uniref:DUF2059 domain-containing protein n=1 Tax=Flavobacterium TaxID=237 RepID=UPI000969293E|nr:MULTISPECIES: DUF2059 domain-containing protein [Flavobacterium]MBN9284391.1 DUF2059 domain-containing protein [Flavobacterium sp.]OJV72919.1 MAG: hypothetical protein BGO42_00295 [Flavobacterium sp. 40-81]